MNVKHLYGVTVKFEASRKLTPGELASLIHDCAAQIENPYVYGDDGEQRKADFTTTVTWATDDIM